MADGRSKNGGARPNAGRKRKRASEELKKLMDEACPAHQREKIIGMMAEQAQAGNVQAASFIFNRLFGTPKKGDEIETQERVEAAINDILETAKQILPPDHAQRFFEALSRRS